MPIAVPPGSMWRVLHYCSESVKQTYNKLDIDVPPNFWYTVRAMSHPFAVPVSPGVMGALRVNEVRFNPQELILVGNTVPSLTQGWKHPFVEVLYPRVAYINRVHFNDGSLYLERVA